jgi:hypothetical protein
MKRFERYVEELEKLAHDVLNGRLSESHEARISAALDGEVAAQLRNLVALSKRRKLGAFFTTSDIRRRVATATPSTSHVQSIVDVACGAGDLLLACSEKLPVNSSLARTLAAWGSVIHGYDVQSEFIRAARARLILSAFVRCGRIDDKGSQPRTVIKKLFPGLRVGDGLAAIARRVAHSTFVLNPPFGTVTIPRDCDWAQGQVSAAAVFLSRCVEAAEANTHIVAVLPDVLRTGARYRRWREHITSRSNIEDIEVIGQFSDDVDIDVFLLRLFVNGSENSSDVTSDWWSLTAAASDRPTVLDFFDVSVGAVVPHRAAWVGPGVPYVFARGLPPWETHEAGTHWRRFEGRTFKPPFVVVRRTSSPTDRERPVATLILGKSAVAVENHLLVLEPRDRSTQSCRRLLTVLRSDETRKWIDQRIRCRHLTVGALSELPWLVG